ncbi:MAG: hypothetical protein R3C56_29665 [Pirellulaceae bacterium]
MNDRLHRLVGEFTKLRRDPLGVFEEQPGGNDDDAVIANNHQETFDTLLLLNGDVDVVSNLDDSLGELGVLVS